MLFFFFFSFRVKIISKKLIDIESLDDFPTYISRK